MGVGCFVVSNFKRSAVACYSLDESQFNVPFPFFPSRLNTIGHFSKILVEALNLISVLDYTDHVFAVDGSKSGIITVVEGLDKRFPDLVVDLSLKAVGLGTRDPRNQNKDKK